MNNKTKTNDIEEQIASMLEKVLKDEESDSNKIPLGFNQRASELFEPRKNQKKSKTHTNQKPKFTPTMGAFQEIHRGFNMMDKSKKSNTVGFQRFNPMLRMPMYGNSGHPNVIGNSGYFLNQDTILANQLQNMPFYQRNCFNRVQNTQNYPYSVPQHIIPNNNNFNEIKNYANLCFYQIYTCKQKNKEILLYEDNSENKIHNEIIYAELERALTMSNKIDEGLFNQLKGQFIGIIKTQKGSRIFQKYLTNTGPLIIKNIFNEIQLQMNELILDIYANYFCQKLFEVLQKEERMVFLKEVIFYLILVAG
jgi:hypothetical protein